MWMMMGIMWMLMGGISSTTINTSTSISSSSDNSVQATAMFVFGDSLVDNGNNNFLNSIAKSNYYPYGIDSNRGPTGKFSNGETFVDYLGTYILLSQPKRLIFFIFFYTSLMNKKWLTLAGTGEYHFQFPVCIINIYICRSLVGSSSAASIRRSHHNRSKDPRRS